MPIDHTTNFEAGVIIPVNKPYGWTSADVVRKLKYLLQNRLGLRKLKIGHAGTLDPLATGILLICTGKATKQVEALQAQEKEYIADICFGATTPSFDKEKEIDARYPFEHITESMVSNCLQQSFLGEQQQVPPLFSAKMVGGKRAYEFARQGEEVELKASTVTIYEAELLSFQLPNAKVRLLCSKGTYIRSFARDLGVELNSGAYLSGLCRTRSGIFTLNDAFSIEEFESRLQKA